MELNEAHYDLQIDKEFQNLINPLTKEEFQQLERNILKEGCRDPIVVWNRTIIDGHNRYRICSKHGISFQVVKKEFDCREAVLAWICANQLGRRNVSDETKKYLIGKQYDAEKKAARFRNPHGTNQYTTKMKQSPNEEQIGKEDKKPRIRTASKIAEQQHISSGTVQKYANYTHAIDKIKGIAPKIIPKILSGEYKVSHENIVMLSQLPDKEIKRIANKIESTDTSFVPYNQTRREISSYEEKTLPKESDNAPSVKDTPDYDPDAEINGLSLTMPSWVSSISRVAEEVDFNASSKDAVSKLEAACYRLKHSVEKLIGNIRRKQ